MENKMTRNFIVKFNELSPANKKYLIAIQQALAFAQSSSLEAEKAASENRCNIVSQNALSTTKLEYS